MNKIFTIVGTRPNFIKIDPDLPQTIVHTGQHYDYKMSKVFFEDLNLPEPTFYLKCKNDVGLMISKLIELFKKEEPDLVLVFGDTHSSTAGALAAAYCKIKVAHVEAGLRSNRLTMPEEVNRRVIDSISTVFFCPNVQAELNLLREGKKDNVFVVGDPMFDALLRMIPIKRGKDYKKNILITLHRDFNVDNKEFLQGFFKTCSQTNEKFIFPVHPRTAKKIKEFGIGAVNVKLIKPQSYKKMLSLISDAKKVITDSGGVQREAYWMNVPVIIMRDETEWTEIIAKKSGVLVGSDWVKLKTAIETFKGMTWGPPIGGVNKKIKEILYKYV